MYHEAPLATLLETLSYHSEVVEAAEDYVLDLLDYCHRKITETLGKHERGENLKRNRLDHGDGGDSTSTTEYQIGDLQRQKSDLDFCLSAKAVTIARYICEHLGSLPLSVTNRLLNHLDLPALFVSLVVASPWTASDEKSGAVFKFSDNEWRRVKEGDEEQITKTEGQIWIGLFHLLMDGRSQENIHSIRCACTF